MDPDTALPGRRQVTDLFSHALEQRLGSTDPTESGHLRGDGTH